MDNFEPKCEHFFDLLASEDVAGTLASRPENFQEMLYFTSADSVNSVTHSFRAVQQPVKRQRIMQGLVSILPFSKELLEAILGEPMPGLNAVEAYEQLLSLETSWNTYIKQLNNSVRKNNSLDTYTAIDADNQKRLDELGQKLEKEREMLTRFAQQMQEIEAIEQEIEELQKQQSEEYWDDKKREVEAVRSQLQMRQDEFRKDCQELTSLKETLEEHENGTVSKDFTNCLESLAKLAQSFPKDEVN